MAHHQFCVYVHTLFNLIVVNERALMGSSFNFGTDRYMENIIRHGAFRCYIFQLSVLISGILLLVYGNMGIQALWTNYMLLAKTILLIILMGLLTYAFFTAAENRILLRKYHR